MVRTPTGWRGIPALLGLLLVAAGCASAPRPAPSPAPGARPGAAPAPAPLPSRSRKVPPPRKIVRMEFPDALPVPVDGVSMERLYDSFGDPRGGGRKHEGIDIMAPRETPVRSPVDGWVSRRGMRRLGGITISVIGPAGHRHYFAHLERWADLKQGDRVRAGDIVGYVGDSGNARGGPTHLHYAIYPERGGVINPYPLLLRGPGPFDTLEGAPAQ